MTQAGPWPLATWHAKLTTSNKQLHAVGYCKPQLPSSPLHNCCPLHNCRSCCTTEDLEHNCTTARGCCCCPRNTADVTTHRGPVYSAAMSGGSRCGCRLMSASVSCSCSCRCQGISLYTSVNRADTGGLGTLLARSRDSMICSQTHTR